MRKFIFHALVVFMICTGNISAQTTTKGIVRDIDGNPLPGVNVKIIGTSITKITNSKGEYLFSSLPTGLYLLSFSSNGFVTTEQKVDLKSSLDSIPGIKLGYNLFRKTQNPSYSERSISSDYVDIESRKQYTVRLIPSDADPFERSAALSFNAAHFLIRGYNSDGYQIYMNGLPVENPESGFDIWDTWGGLGDITQNIDSHVGLSPSNFSFGGIGGMSNLVTRASQQRLSTQMTYASSNQDYRNRLSITHSTGMMENDVAITLGGSRSWADQGYVDGTFYDAYAYFISIERKFDNKHSVSFTTFNAPNMRGMQGAATEETNRLVGSNFYNPNWGLQNDKKRNSRILNHQKPTFMLSHYWNIDDKINLTTNLGYSFGTYSNTALNWSDTQNPYPDYSSKLPSNRNNSDQAIIDQITNAFKNDINTRQIDWNSLYQTNYRSIDTAKYIIEERLTDSKQTSFTSVINWDLNPNIKITGGVEYTNYKGRNYKTINDLLGGKYWLDVIQFPERDFGNHDLAQSDLNNPDKQVIKGDAFGYDYMANINTVKLWAVSNYTFNKFDFNLGTNYEMTKFWRMGSMQNGRFPASSKGNSEKLVFNNFSFKGNATWRINYRNFIDVNAGLMTKAPYFINSFVSPRLSNLIIPDLTDEKILTADVNYNLHSPIIKARFSAYYTRFLDQSEMKSYYRDSLNTFVNYAMNGINKEHKGIEIGAEIKASPRFTINLAAALGSFKYTSRPNVTITKDNSSPIFTYSHAVYIQNFHIANTPQTAALLGIEYISPKYILLSTTFNFFANTYVDFNPERRTDDPTNQAKDLTSSQQKVPTAFLIDACIGKSWKIDNYYFSINFKVTNVLNKTDFQTGGYEQLRYSGSTSNVSTISPRYYYAFGRIYFLNLAYRF
jgi:hypothetical protein